MATTAILNKVARNAALLGLTVVSNDGATVVVSNGSNNLSVSVVAASISSPMGGVDGTVSPFLGIGIANPGKLKLKSAISTAGTIADVLDGATAAKMLHMLGGFANNVVLENANAGFSLELRGTVDSIGLGQ
jgi:hypothetical protein